MEALQKTLECVDSEALVQFLRSDEVSLMSPAADRSLEITDQSFDFSKIGEYRKTKTIEITSGKRITFERCIFIGSLRFKNSNFENIRFKNCHFIKPDFGVNPSGLESISFSEVTTKYLTIEQTLLRSPISIHQGCIKELRFNYVTCPRLWLQSMSNEGSILSIYRFLGQRIYLPTSTQFKTLWIDDLIFRQVEGNTRNVQINRVDLS